MQKITRHGNLARGAVEEDKMTSKSLDMNLISWLYYVLRRICGPDREAGENAQ
jgi:hypothetical protein